MQRNHHEIFQHAKHYYDTSVGETAADSSPTSKLLRKSLKAMHFCGIRQVPIGRR